VLPQSLRTQFNRPYQTSPSYAFAYLSVKLSPEFSNRNPHPYPIMLRYRALFRRCQLFKFSTNMETDFKASEERETILLPSTMTHRSSPESAPHASQLSAHQTPLPSKANKKAQPWSSRASQIPVPAMSNLKPETTSSSSELIRSNGLP
jgi:hypothetical protein